MKYILVLLVTFAVVFPVLAKITLPYHAGAGRKQQITEGHGRIVAGMTLLQIEAVLGKPDYVTPLYEPKIKNPTQIGTTHWYLIQQLKEHGSVIEVGRIGVAVRTDMKGTAIRIDSFGLP